MAGVAVAISIHQHGWPTPVAARPTERSPAMVRGFEVPPDVALRCRGGLVATALFGGLDTVDKRSPRSTRARSSTTASSPSPSSGRDWSTSCTVAMASSAKSKPGMTLPRRGRHPAKRRHCARTTPRRAGPAGPAEQGVLRRVPVSRRLADSDPRSRVSPSSWSSHGCSLRIGLSSGQYGDPAGMEEEVHSS